MTPPLTPEELASLAVQNPGAARAAVLHAIERGLARGETSQSLSPALRSMARALIEARAVSDASEPPASADLASAELEAMGLETPREVRDVLDTLDMQINAVHEALAGAKDGKDAEGDALLNRLASLEERYADELSRRFTRRRPFDLDAAARAMRNADALLDKHAGAASDDPAGE